MPDDTSAHQETGATSHPPSCTCLAHPLPASMRVRDARDAYLAENGFTLASYDSPTTAGSFLGMKFSVPNPPPHQRAVRLHDLHHVANGYGTDHAGEGQSSSWQARRGLRGTGMYNLAAGDHVYRGCGRDVVVRCATTTTATLCRPILVSHEGEMAAGI